MNSWAYPTQAKIIYLIQLQKILWWQWDEEGRFWSERALPSHWACLCAELLICVSNLLLQSVETPFNSPCLDAGHYCHWRCPRVSHHFQLPAWKDTDPQRSSVVSAMPCKYTDTSDGTYCLL